MRKRMLCLILAAALLILLAACGKAEETPQAPTVSPQQTETEPTAARNEKTVKITLPLAYVEEDYRGALESYRINRGFLDLKVNEKKQTVTFKMTESGHRFLLTDIALQVLEAIYAMPEDPVYFYLKSIDEINDETFDSVTVSVERAAYEANDTEGVLPFVLANRCITYQAYTQKNHYRCTVVIKDAADGSEVFRQTYKEHN